MEHHPTPPRKREVRINELDGELTMRLVANIGQTANTTTLRKLISGDQLAVSVDGLFSAHIVTFRRGAEIVVHSELGVLSPLFQRLRPDVGTRILRVEVNSLLVWGKVDRHPLGLWRLDQSGGTFLAPIDRLLRNSSGLLRGSVDGSTDMHIVTAWGGLWSMSDKALVTPFLGGLCVVEELDGALYAYKLGKNGDITSFQMLTLQDAERPVGIVHWRNRLMLAVARGSQSWLVELNRRSSGETPVKIQIDGDLHGIWSSPRSQTLALLVHPRGEPDDVRRLQLDDDRVVQEGRFSLDPASITWSPGENVVAVKIREGAGLDRVSHEIIVGTGVDRRIPLGFSYRGFLVNDRGRFAAAIRHDGVYDQPEIGGRAGTKVPLAWNLHYTPEGDISWTTVHDDRILTWTQQRSISK